MPFIPKFTIDELRDIFRSLEPGLEIINGKGSGAFKAVYEAKRGSDHIALKILDMDNLDLGRLSREIRGMLLVQSPYVARFYEFQNRQTPTLSIAYLLEEFIEGEELSEAMTHNVPYSGDQLIDFLDKMLQGLDACWQRRVVHRDIKPGNIMVRPDGSPVIVDFGMCRILDDSSLTATDNPFVLGTVIFAPPEVLQYSKRLIDSKTDLFSLGVTVYWMATGIHPFLDPKDPKNDMRYRLANATATPPQQFNSSIPETLSKFILKLMDRDRVKRHKNAAHAREHLLSITQK